VFEVFSDNSSSKQEVVNAKSDKGKKQNGEIKLVKNGDGQLIEVYVPEGVTTDKVPKGWVIKGKKYNTDTGEWMDVYRQPLTPNVFKEKFNRISRDAIANEKFLIKDISIQHGEVNDVFQIKFSKSAAFDVVLNDNNEITNLVAFLEEDGMPNDNLEILKTLIKIFSPEVKEDDLYLLLDKLKVLTTYSELMDEVGKSYSKEVGFVKYSMIYKLTTDGNVLYIFGVDVTQ
jgi:hypothetical protein